MSDLWPDDIEDETRRMFNESEGRPYVIRRNVDGSVTEFYMDWDEYSEEYYQDAAFWRARALHEWRKGQGVPR